MAHNTLVGGTSYTVKGGKMLSDGTGYAIKKGRTLVNGTGYDITFITYLRDLDVGTSVYLKVNGVSKEFLVIHQGLPSSIYDNSCDGSWLMMKDLYTSMQWYPNNDTNAYSGSLIHSYLNSQFIALLETDIQSAVKTVKIPYAPDGNTSVLSGSSGLSTKGFLLSGCEVGGGSYQYSPAGEGSCLDYFDGADNTKRLGYLDGTVTGWHLRSPEWGDTDETLYVDKIGAVSNGYPRGKRGIRPTMIFSGDEIVDEDFNVVV